MEAANNLCAIKILLMLLQCVTYMHANCYSREYKLLPGGYNIYMKIGVHAFFKRVNRVDINDCVQLCANETFCNVWRFDGGSCQIFHSRKDKVRAIKSTNPTSKTYYETAEDDQWMKIYYVKGGSGIHVASTFLADGVNSWIPVNCTVNLCPEFFRSFFIDAWITLPIMKVKFSLFKNDTEAVYVIFDGQGTNSRSWFIMSRVLESPWKDFYKGAMYIDFAINYYFVRSFYAAKYHRVCQQDIGWIAVIEPNVTCKWNNHMAFPDIIYSDKEDATIWSTEQAHADALAVYISF